MWTDGVEARTTKRIGPFMGRCRPSVRRLASTRTWSTRVGPSGQVVARVRVRVATTSVSFVCCHRVFGWRLRCKFLCGDVAHCGSSKMGPSIKKEKIRNRDQSGHVHLIRCPRQEAHRRLINN
jgi:hypothetical protein